MNCMLIETKDSAIVIDVGILFGDRPYGVDIIHPDFSLLEKRRHKLKAIVLTHGHEDHIGSIGMLSRKLALPVYGTAYALELAYRRMEEHAPKVHFDEREVGLHEPYTIGDFTFTHFQVTHSIPESTGLVIDTPAGRIVHSGDFKWDRTPPEGDKFDEDFLRDVSSKGVKLLLADSTNALSVGQSLSEQVVEGELLRVISSAKQAVCVTLFASNAFRMRALYSIAEKTQRKIAFLGRSLQTHSELAADLGYLPEAEVVPKERIKEVDPKRLLLVVTGSQGETQAALHRLSVNQHPEAKLVPGDMVIFSSRMIPGNEKDIWELIHRLEDNGIQTVGRHHEKNIHASGHAYQEELLALFDLIKPESFVPIHGNRTLLKANLELAKKSGVAKTLLAENGDVIDLESLRVVDREHTGYVSTSGGKVLPDDVIAERKRIAETGVLTVVARDDHATVISRGVFGEKDRVQQERELILFIKETIQSAKIKQRNVYKDPAGFKENMVRQLQRHLYPKLGRKPWIDIVLL